MKKIRRSVSQHHWLGLLICIVFGAMTPGSASAAISLHNASLSVSVNPKDGSYEIRAETLDSPVLRAQIGAQVDHHWIQSSLYPHHEGTQSSFQDALGSGHQGTITFRGLSSEPNLVCVLRLYDSLPYGTINVDVVNHTAKTVSIQAIREVDAIGEPRVNLGGAEGADRVMFESFSEDPPFRIGGLGQAPNGTYFGVQDGLIYNLQSKQSLLLAALTSDRFLTELHMQVSKPPMGGPEIASLTVDSTGITEAVRQRDQIPLDQQIQLSLPVGPGETLGSERVAFAAGADYHAQLLAYGEAVRRLHHARVSSVPPMGWWAWTAAYGGITEGDVMTNAKWLAQHLKSLGYNYFHIDEGYDYARGEYIATNATQFPDGMRKVGYKITSLGLTVGVWTAPFEVSERSRVYERHKDWLVHDAHGRPILIGHVEGNADRLFVLDTTNPGAKQYLLKTYRILTREWGVRYIKLDFMDSAAIEGYYHRHHTTALEAERIGLEIIRQAVGDNVLLDKDGSPMLAPVGLVDEGRISVDTGHSFQASLDAAPNIAARYYMNRNFYISDPDAFSVSTQVEPEQTWHNAKSPLTIDEAKVQIVLAAVAGGMYAIGDDLPTLAADPERLALVENRDLLRMVELRRAATPVDLMSFRAEDNLPSIFSLPEDARQSMLAVFNWTEGSRAHTLNLSNLGLAEGRSYQGYDVLNGNQPVTIENGSIAITGQPPHSVRLIKIVDTSVPAAAPSVSAKVPSTAEVGEAIKLRATSESSAVPALSFHWDFGDGTSAGGPEVSHTYTRAGAFNVKLTVDGVDGVPAEKSFSVEARGTLKTAFHLDQNRRYSGPDEK
ncbi:MAG: PKD domain-containing protein [Terriglobia bacterium]